MEFHDAWLRRTVSEMLVAEGEDVRDRFAEIAAESERSGLSAQDPLRFQTLSGVGRLLDTVLPEDVPSEVAHGYGVLVYYCYQAWRAADGPLLLEERLARTLCAEPGGEAPAAAPTAAGYLQPPRNLFWVRLAADAPAEPVDAVLWEIRSGEVGAALVSGIREDRPGFGLSLAAPIPWALFEEAAVTRVRPSTPDFESTLPGGEAAGLLSFETHGEVFKLLARVFAWLERRPECLSDVRPPPAETTPIPSRLAFRRLGECDA